ncbi:MAG: FAD-binding protein, partial [Firmicutes bacterium]|nr:FAD-binding protein [Bacillota bacterium]
MNKAALAADLQALLKEPVIIDAPMSKHTTWKIGGPADIMVFPTCTEELSSILPLLKGQGINWLVIGNGSNLLVADKGIRGVVIKMGENFASSQWRGLEVKASSGMLLATLALEAAERGAAGIEFARGIPGSVGGAVRMNAGAYGSNIGNYVTKVEGVD